MTYYDKLYKATKAMSKADAVDLLLCELREAKEENERLKDQITWHRVSTDKLETIKNIASR